MQVWCVELLSILEESLRDVSFSSAREVVRLKGLDGFGCRRHGEVRFDVTRQQLVLLDLSFQGKVSIVCFPLFLSTTSATVFSQFGRLPSYRTGVRRLIPDVREDVRQE